MGLLDRWKPFILTLRFRLMVWNAIVVILTAVVTLICVREGVRLSLIHEMDQILIDDTMEIGITISEFQYPGSGELWRELDQKARIHRQHHWFVVLLDEYGREVWASANAPEPRPQMPAVQDLIPVSADGYRFVQNSYRDAGSRRIFVRVGTPLNFLDEEIARIDRLVASVAAVVLIVAPLCGYWLAGRATRPLAEIISTAARLRPIQLNERLPIRGTGDELDQLSTTFNGLLDRIGHFLDQKSDLLANAAHELRTPLAAIRSSVEVALSSDRSPEEYSELLAEVIDECSSLEVLVNQLLLLAEAEADRLNIEGEPVRVDELLSRSVDMFHGVAEHRGIDLQAQIAPDIIVTGNRSHVRQVFSNLLDNALKFTHRGGTVTVELERDQAASRARFTVRDTGIGIAEAELPHVFNRFYRGDRARRRQGEARGTGLGLCICKAVVSAHGGTISIASQIGRGTAVTVLWPLASEDTIQRSTPPMAAFTAEGQTPPNS